MQRNFFTTMLILLLSILCASMTVLAGCPGCDLAKTENSWCEDCNVGYVSGQETKCQSCFDFKNSSEGSYCEDCEKHVDGLLNSEDSE